MRSFRPGTLRFRTANCGRPPWASKAGMKFLSRKGGLATQAKRRAEQIKVTLPKLVFTSNGAAE
jgi:hypothetical protein